MLDRATAERGPLGTVTYGYDGAGRRTHMAVAGTPPVMYGYDAASRLTSISRTPTAPASLEYDAAGRRTRLTLPNQVSTEYQYDAASRLIALIYSNAAGPLGDLTYQYDRAGNRVGVGGSFARTSLPDAVADATYDAANRQLSFGTATMAYDANGNMIGLTEAAGPTQFGWDARGRLATLVTPTANLAFTYDPTGRRVERRRGTAVTTYRYDGSDVVEETAGTSSTSYLRTLTIDEPLSRGTGEFYVADGLGSVIGLTDADGTLGTRYTYAPFGGTVIDGLSENPFQFTGRENDGSGVYYYRARYYHPELSRFLSEDPLHGLSVRVPPYQYARDNPIVYADPLGLVEINLILGTSTAARAKGGAIAQGGGGLALTFNTDTMTVTANGFSTTGTGVGNNTGLTAYFGIVTGPLEGITTSSNLGLSTGAVGVTGSRVSDPTTGSLLGSTFGVNLFGQRGVTFSQTVDVTKINAPQSTGPATSVTGSRSWGGLQGLWGEPQGLWAGHH
jgi:RHS repeat-associated protein